MSLSENFQLYPPYSSEELSFLTIFSKVSLSVAMTPNEIVGFGAAAQVSNEMQCQQIKSLPWL